ncbi:mediator of RNA polymerase II transcription subunit 13 [Phanerochaete sordida]|uniref:Mediator of RNA polymerase II transcription subunit 13 n=1 Tax=Phanerochaete sordida TaxID=48140 RepID=A0A9P3FXA7_9APHY|nr:mediator of RNA polymerase II transcription subunit 13 [Phanerochaete sordida]
MYCELQVSLTQARLLIHPILRSTQYFPLATSLPLPTGTPIVLLPHGIPAFYLNTYSGAVGNLTSQFDEALTGLGAGNWKKTTLDEPTDCPCYLIAWVSVQNKQGEEKGLPVIWPVALSVLPGGLCPLARHKLPCLPDLPPQLLASPPAMPVQAPPINLPFSALNLSPASTPTTSDIAPSPRTTNREQLSATSRRPRHYPSNRPSAFDSLRAFRSLSIGGKNTRVVAYNVSVYVDSVAKERERERERLKREREGSSSRISASPQKLESSQSPAVHFGQEQGPAPAQYKQASPYSASDQVAANREEQPAAFPSWDTMAHDSIGHMGGSLPPVDVAPPQTLSTGTVSADVADMLSETGGLPGGEVPMTVDGDAFNEFDATWAQSGTDIMDMDMSLDQYNFAMDMSGANNNESANLNVDDGFGLFTDDDFDFFDRPQPSSGHPSRQPLPLPVASNPSASTAVSLNGPQTSGPGPPTLFGGDHPVPWTAHIGLEGLTPHSLPASTPGLPLAPDLVPSTPQQTPSTQSGPATPAVLLDHHIHARRNSTSSQGSIGFDPIPFSPAHKATDGKYSVGKFALPTPPPDDVERVWPLPRGVQDPPAIPVGWRFSYGSATDPRIAIVRRLVGAKRKRQGEDENGRNERMVPSWMHEREEWASSPPSQDSLEGDSKTDSDQDADEDAEDEEPNSSTPSRSFTPPLSNLPLGPSLVATSFHHSFLLPLSSPLRPPGAAAIHGTPDAGLGPISVPTPVSPAATLGTASERAKTLESAAQFLVNELVENPVWADAWRANLGAQLSSSPEPDIWPDDIRLVTTLLKAIPGLRSDLELREAYHLDADPGFREIDPPMLVVGKTDALLQVLPSALRFWEKLGLRPRGGSKDVKAFLFFEASDDAREAELDNWLEVLGKTYAAKQFGTHAPGRAAGCTRDGLVPVQFDTFRKTLVSFVQGLPDLGTPVVFYIVVPTHMITLTSAPLRHIFSAMKRARKAHPDTSLLFHLIPEPLTSSNMEDPAMRHFGFETIAEAVYDRILVLVRRMISRVLTADEPRMQVLLQEPAFALARPSLRKPTFRLEARASTLDVVDRFAILHVGYRISPCGRWLLVACVDQRGEMHELKAWVLQADGAEDFVVGNVWALAANIAARADVEWRLVITKHGAMSEQELDAWRKQLSSAEQTLPSTQPLEVLLLVADHTRSWTFLLPEHVESPKPPKSPYRVHKQSPGTVLHEISSTTFLLQRDSPYPVILDAPEPLSPLHPFIPDTEGESVSPAFIVQPLASATLIRVPAGTDLAPASMLHLHLLYEHKIHSPHMSLPAEHETLKDIAQSYYDLSILARHRWKLRANPVLPYHLAALDVTCTALACDESLTD